MIKKIQQFIADVKIEMGKVAWPTHKELTNSTGIVVLVSIMFTIFIFLADLIVSRAIQLFY
jgi:preprotein translocase subunit SecE